MVYVNNVIDVFGCFFNMNVDLYNFVLVFNCVLVQWFVCCICEFCWWEVVVDDEFFEESGFDLVQYCDVIFYEGVGCMECNGIGFCGRLVVFELFDLLDNICELIFDCCFVFEIKCVVYEEGMFFLCELVFEKVFEGVIIFCEINKVIFVD